MAWAHEGLEVPCTRSAERVRVVRVFQSFLTWLRAGQSASDHRRELFRYRIKRRSVSAGASQDQPSLQAADDHSGQRLCAPAFNACRAKTFNKHLLPLLKSLLANLGQRRRLWGVKDDGGNRTTEDVARVTQLMSSRLDEGVHPLGGVRRVSENLLQQLRHNRYPLARGLKDKFLFAPGEVIVQGATRSAALFEDLVEARTMEALAVYQAGCGLDHVCAGVLSHRFFIAHLTEYVDRSIMMTGLHQRSVGTRSRL